MCFLKQILWEEIAKNFDPIILFLFLWTGIRKEQCQNRGLAMSFLSRISHHLVATVLKKILEGTHSRSSTIEDINRKYMR